MSVEHLHPTRAAWNFAPASLTAAAVCVTLQLATRLFGLDQGASMVPLLDLANHVSQQLWHQFTPAVDCLWLGNG